MLVCGKSSLFPECMQTTYQAGQQVPTETQHNRLVTESPSKWNTDARPKKSHAEKITIPRRETPRRLGVKTHSRITDTRVRVLAIHGSRPTERALGNSRAKGVITSMIRRITESRPPVRAHGVKMAKVPAPQKSPVHGGQSLRVTRLRAFWDPGEAKNRADVAVMREAKPREAAVQASGVPKVGQLGRGPDFRSNESHVARFRKLDMVVEGGEPAWTLRKTLRLTADKSETRCDDLFGPHMHLIPDSKATSGTSHTSTPTDKDIVQRMRGRCRYPNDLFMPCLVPIGGRHEIRFCIPQSESEVETAYGFC
ncbi:hypothetical protein C8R44DRAFT_726351 [Mycena epipterygia]|nr:hypothetical protein C8R44DRAFT_726351 [Mycena epipterygia]